MSSFNQPIPIGTSVNPPGEYVRAYADRIESAKAWLGERYLLAKPVERRP
jgi:hypothetical protein